MSKWISIKDKLPENDNLVLTVTDIERIAFDYELARYKKLWKNKVWETLHSEEIKPTHWQPLPEPPTTEEGLCKRIE